MLSLPGTLASSDLPTLRQRDTTLNAGESTKQPPSYRRAERAGHVLEEISVIESHEG